MNDDDDKVIPIRRAARPLAEVGGVVDESRVTLALYGEELVPSEVTALLEVEPTTAFKRGEKRGERIPPKKKGAWFLEETGVAPIGPEKLMERLLHRIPRSDAAVWSELRSQYDMQLRLGIFFSGWNKGFSLAPELVHPFVEMGCSFEFDIYADHGEED